MTESTPPIIPRGTITETVITKAPVDESTRKWQLSGTDLLYDFKLWLEGKTYDNMQDKWVQLTSPVMNPYGISEVCRVVAWYLNKNMQLSYFEPKEINELIRGFAHEISYLFEYEYRAFGVDKQLVPMLARNIVDFVWSALNRARYGGEKQFIEGTEQRRILQNEGSREGERSAWDKIPLLGGKR